jgi:putative oxygen-independent coproporphyrinogen III oxidase
VPSALPDGDPAPVTGELPGNALAGVGRRPIGFYVHVPFCATRCGYCDFNTYTATELGGGASAASYADTAISEIEFARRVLGERDAAISSVFFGGGTPTLLPAADLVRVLQRIDKTFGLAAGAEVTTEANPESVTPQSLAVLREGGFSRISLGMQSAVPGVLATLDRQHTPGRAVAAVAEARAAGFEQISLDLIYGTHGETDDDWRESLAAAIGANVDHVSAYSLIVEPGTRLAARVARGELPMPDDDVLADRYAIADEALAGAGLQWYEVSNWARSAQTQARHNLLYWTGGDWWGIGPGAHSHVGGVRWWNVKHPRDYATRLAAQHSPAAAREVLSAGDRVVEDIMLRLRLRTGLPLATLSDAAAVAATRARDAGLLERAAYDDRLAVLTLPGRLLADAVVRDLVE